MTYQNILFYWVSVNIKINGDSFRMKDFKNE